MLMLHNYRTRVVSTLLSTLRSLHLSTDLLVCPHFFKIIFGDFDYELLFLAIVLVPAVVFEPLGMPLQLANLRTTIISAGFRCRHASCGASVIDADKRGAGQLSSLQTRGAKQVRCEASAICRQTRRTRTCTVNTHPPTGILHHLVVLVRLLALPIRFHEHLSHVPSEL